jgi:hypothetical protein
MRGLVGPLVAVAVLAAPAVASADTIADWELNEARGATTMQDSGPNGFTGTIGNKVTTAVSTGDGGLAYSFPGPEWGYDPGRLVTVPDDPRLDPGTQPYAVTIRFRTTQVGPNIVQKGQSGQTGGYWKLVLHKGWPRCHFRDGNNNTKAIGFVDGPTSLKVNDGRWHTLRCERLSNGVRVTLEPGTPNEVSKFIAGAIGNIDNRRPFMIGGKLDCASASVGCDYFKGQLDWIHVERP